MGPPPRSGEAAHRWTGCELHRFAADGQVRRSLCAWGPLPRCFCSRCRAAS